MIFVPSLKGLSHCPQEATSEEDLLLGVKILGRVMTELACKIQNNK
jgi:acetylornithine deacetylase/succinyl-diaminopimelate desuccinylase-like protein